MREDERKREAVEDVERGGERKKGGGIERKRERERIMRCRRKRGGWRGNGMGKEREQHNKAMDTAMCFSCTKQSLPKTYSTRRLHQTTLNVALNTIKKNNNNHTK